MTKTTYLLDYFRTADGGRRTADGRTVDVHISRLRHKLGASYGKYLVTEYRVGYQFRSPIC